MFDKIGYMFRKIILLVIAIAVLAGLFALSSLFGETSPNFKKLDIDVERDRAVENLEDLTLRGKGTFGELMERKENLECTILYKSNDINEDLTEGSLFVSQDRLRGDFIVPDTGEDLVSSMIISERILYSWSEIEGEKYGIKVDLDELEEYKSRETGATLDTKEPIPLEAKVTYICKPWNTVDGSIFLPPTDLIFSDFNKMIDKGMEYGNIY